MLNFSGQAEVHLYICSRRRKQTTFSGGKCSSFLSLNNDCVSRARVMDLDESFMKLRLLMFRHFKLKIKQTAMSL